MCVRPTTAVFCPLGNSVNLRVANSPSDNFDGTVNITFRVDAMDASADRESSKWASVAEVNMSVTFFHCQEGMFWNFMDCKLCTEADLNGDEVRLGRKTGSRGGWLVRREFDRDDTYAAFVELVHFACN